MKRLVVIDSDKSSRESIRAIFGQDYAIAMAASPAEAQPLFKKQTDMLIIEMTPPDRGARKLLQSLPESIPVLALSVTPNSSQEVDLIVKPFDVKDIRLKVAELSKKKSYFPTPSGAATDEALTLEEAVNNFERRLIVRALKKTGGVQTKAAELLGTTRRILRYRMDKLDIEISTSKPS